MLLSTPEVSGTDYGFNIEGHPVAGGGTYAVPLGMYDDVSFARVVSGNDGLDMNIEVPANIVRAHPGQVYPPRPRSTSHRPIRGLLDAQDHRAAGRQELRLRPVRRRQRRPLPLRVTEQRILQDDATIDLLSCPGSLHAARQARAEGELMVMPASLQVVPGHDYSVTVKNVGDGPLYLNIALQQVMNPGIEPERKVPLSEIERLGLLAHPDRLSVGSQSRKIALKSLAEPSAEALYRLYVIPAKVMQVEQAPQDKITAPMSVAIGYGVLVRHMPPVAKQTTGWTHRCEGREMVLENTGNVRVVLLDARAGTSAEPRNLALFPGVRASRMADCAGTTAARRARCHVRDRAPETPMAAP